jgi:hypothetical protein
MPDDLIAIGVGENEVPTLEQCAAIQHQREKFFHDIDWSGNDQDQVREVSSDLMADPNRLVVVVIHKMPRLSACQTSELPDMYKNLRPLSRTTTLVYQAGDVDYLEELSSDEGSFAAWYKERTWSGQTIFGFELMPELPESTQQQPELPSHQHFQPPAAPTSPPAPAAVTVPVEEICSLCEGNGAIAECGCCVNKPKFCGSACLLRHTEGRYELHKPDEDSPFFENICSLDDSDSVCQLREQSQCDKKVGLVLVTMFDDTAGTRRALELLQIEPALHINILRQDSAAMNAAAVIEKAYPQTVIWHGHSEYEVAKFGKQVKSTRNLVQGLFVGLPKCRPSLATGHEVPQFSSRESAVCAELFASLQAAAPRLQWHDVMLTTSSLPRKERNQVGSIIGADEIEIGPDQTADRRPILIDGSSIGPVKHRRLYWPSFPLSEALNKTTGWLLVESEDTTHATLYNDTHSCPSVTAFLDPGASLAETEGLEDIFLSLP